MAHLNGYLATWVPGYNFMATRQVRNKHLNKDAVSYLVYPCTQDKIALFVPLQSKDGTFVLAKRTGQVSCG